MMHCKGLVNYFKRQTLIPASILIGKYIQIANYFYTITLLYYLTKKEIQ